MPIYEYRCATGHEFEVFQSMSEDPISTCPECGAKVERVFNPVAVHFKGSGFYTTDYARSGSKSSSSTDGKTDSEKSKKDGSGDSSSDSSGKKDSGGEKAAASSSDN